VARRKATQSTWRSRNPDYFTARRMKERASQVSPPAPLRMPRPLDRLPWDLAQDQFGVQGADFLGVLGKVLLGVAQDQRSAQVAETP
jgi:hypothetical protein